MAFFTANMYESVCIVAFTYIVENFFDLLCINLWKTRKNGVFGKEVLSDEP